MPAYRLIAGVALWGALGLLPGTLAPAHAEPAPLPAAAQEDLENLRDPAALAELKRATDFLTGLPRFHIKATVIYDVVQDDGRKLQFEKHGVISLQRPDRFFAEIELDDGRHRKLWYDGKMLSIAELSRKLHTRMSAPPTIDGTLDMLEKLFKDPMPIADILYSDLSPVAQRAFEADIVGDSLVNGRPCVQLAFRGETVDWQIWVEKGDRPYIRKLVISYREQPGTPQSVAMFEHWEAPASFSEELFTFVAPAGSQWINVLAPIAPESGKGGQP